MSKVDAVKRRVQDTLGTDLKRYPGGYPDHAGSALVDAALSIRAQYGNSPDTGVRGAVTKFAAQRPDATNNLTVLGDLNPTELAETIGNHQRSAKRLKTECIVDAARALSAAGITSAEEFRTAPDPNARKRAYQGVKGLGPQTYAYLGMLLGLEDVKADVWVQRFVSLATGEDTSADETQRLVVAAAAELEVNATRLDHAIWSYQRSAEADDVERIERDAEGVGEDS